jgi:hypothetical protein
MKPQYRYSPCTTPANWMSSDSVIFQIEKPNPVMRGLLVRPYPASKHLPFSVSLTASAGSPPYRNPLDASKTPVIEAGSATSAILLFLPRRINTPILSSAREPDHQQGIFKRLHPQPARRLLQARRHPSQDLRHLDGLFRQASQARALEPDAVRNAMLAPRGNHLSNALQNRDSVYNAALSKKGGNGLHLFLSGASLN